MFAFKADFLWVLWAYSRMFCGIRVWVGLVLFGGSNAILASTNIIHSL